MKPYLPLLLLLPVIAYSEPAPLFSVPQLAAKSFLLYDYTSRQILVSENGNAHMEPASLTKLMTAYLTFDAIKYGTLSLKQKFTWPFAVARMDTPCFPVHQLLF